MKTADTKKPKVTKKSKKKNLISRRNLSVGSLKKGRANSSNIGKTDIPLNKSAQHSADYAYEVIYSPDDVGVPDNLKRFHDNGKVYPVIVTTKQFHGIKCKSDETVVQFIRFPHPNTHNGLGGRQGYCAATTSNLASFNSETNSLFWSKELVDKYLSQLKKSHHKIFRDETYVFYLEADSWEAAREMADDQVCDERELISVHYEVIEEIDDV